jgi:hypothetical protein
VEAEVLKDLFKVFHGDIRLVVLNACFSFAQAQAIAEAVGCAIGTRGKISDDAAITFGAAFYRALAFGHSVQAAYDQARLALRLEHFEDHECPELVVHPGFDPRRLVLVGAQDVERAGPEGTSLRHQRDEFWLVLRSVLVRLYPGGPQEERIWHRAGGDASRLPLGVNGRTAWFDAMSLMRNGGGGATAEALLSEMHADYPQDPDVVRLMNELSGC